MDGFANRIAATQTLAKLLGTRRYTDPVALPLPQGGDRIGVQSKNGSLLEVSCELALIYT